MHKTMTPLPPAPPVHCNSPVKPACRSSCKAVHSEDYSIVT